MASLSISRAWSETTDFLKREIQLVLPIAFLLISLPAAMLQFALPTRNSPMPLDYPTLMASIGLVLLLIPVVVILSMIGTLAINYLAIRSGATVGEALQVGARRFFFLFVAGLLVGIAAVVLCLPLILFAGGMDSGAGPGGLFMVLLLVYMVLFIAAWIRLMLTTPVAAAETVGPIGIITRSWELTRGHFWKLLGFVILFWVAAFILLFVISIILGIIVFMLAGAPMPGSASAFIIVLISAVLQAVFTAFFATAVSRIYVQLAGSDAGEIFA